MRTKLNAARLTGLAATIAIVSGCDLTPAAPVPDRESSLPGLALAQSAGCVAPPGSLVSWWPGDQDARDIVGDNDGNLIDGALAGAAGKVAGAFSFDGIDDLLEVPNAANLDISGPITLAVWIYLNASTPSPSPGVIVKGDFGNYQESYALGTQPGANDPVFVLKLRRDTGRPWLAGWTDLHPCWPVEVPSRDLRWFDHATLR